MQGGIAAIPPADDSGSDTSRRFTYQAEFAFPYCLSCALGQSVEAVILEHHEDVVVLESGSWLFFQVKTRDPSLGPWRLGDLLRENGALRSLWRTHRRLADVGAIRLIAALEGNLATSDRMVQRLKADDREDDAELVGYLADQLQGSDEEVGSFLSRFAFRDGLPPRDCIRAVNLDLLGKFGPELTRAEAGAIYERFLEHIRSAMDGTLGDTDWEIAVMHPDDLDNARRDLARRKRLVQSVFQDVIAGLSVERSSVLLTLVSPDRPVSSALKVKLDEGGASPAVMSHAAELRAKAADIEFRHLASSLTDAGRATLDNVRGRLQIRHTSLRDSYQSHGTPAIPLWADLISHLSAEAIQLDPHSVFRQDAYLLLGEICNMADECILDFGRKSDAT